MIYKVNVIENSTHYISLPPLDIAIMEASAKLGATMTNIPGLWDVPNYPELTTNQLLSIASNLP